MDIFSLRIMQLVKNQLINNIRPVENTSWSPSVFTRRGYVILMKAIISLLKKSHFVLDKVRDMSSAHASAEFNLINPLPVSLFSLPTHTASTCLMTVHRWSMKKSRDFKSIRNSSRYSMNINVFFFLGNI